jgi:hypothetical protein
MTTTETTSPAEPMREAARAIRSHEKAVPGFCEAVADLLEELARQMDALPCDGAPHLCNNCERRDDFNDALRVAEHILHPFGRTA